MSRRILIVDDETLIRQGIQARLEYLGFEFEKIQEADDGLKALSVLQEEEIDIVITDIRMADMVIVSVEYYDADGAISTGLLWRKYVMT